MIACKGLISLKSALPTRLINVVPHAEKATIKP